MHRVAVLAKARALLLREARPTLESALHQICVALRSQADPHGIIIGLDIADCASGLSPAQITTLALIVNELATNAIKHAFQPGHGGYLTLAARRHDEATLAVIVDDNGVPFPETDGQGSDGLGLGLVRRLVDSIGGLLICPANGSKRIEIRVPTRAE